MVKIKFCGLKRREDIEKALELSVDYMGFVLYEKSPRYVSFEELKELLPYARSVYKVAVMVNPAEEQVEKALEIGFDLLQLHGEESFEFAKMVGIERVIKAFRTCPGLEVEEEWKLAHGVLLDACSYAYGGTGQRADWELAKGLTRRGFRVFLAGGLNSENVSEAIREVRPYAVDVSSGIEIKPGIKNHKKMEEFVHAVKNALKD
ncbi:MAG: phosphoribosylanthranilate isomerase [Aquificaceae bacterium]